MSKSDIDRRAGVVFPAYVRAIIYSVAWLPALGLVTCFFPMFGDLFNRLREKGELPAITDRVLWFVWLDSELFFLPAVFALAFLISVDLCLIGLLQGSARKWFSWIWFGGVILAGLAAAAIVEMALLIPVMKMSASI